MLNGIKLILSLTLLAVGANYFFPEKTLEFKDRVLVTVERVASKLPWVGDTAEEALDELKKAIAKLPDPGEEIRARIKEAEEVFLPSPLRAPREAEVPIAETTLTAGGIIEWTNKNRATESLPSLAANAALTRAAQLKVDDMFTKQYFEHVSPSGEGPADFVKRGGYAYIIIGENLASGNFKGDEGVVTAWMNSPGHRANIMHRRFTEIGVATRRGTFEGREVWMAVQEFGLPLSSCPEPQTSLKQKIDTNQAELERQATDLATRKKEIDETQPKAGPAYNKKVEEYNARVKEYNALLETTKALVVEYNGEVQAFNACLEG